MIEKFMNDLKQKGWKQVEIANETGIPVQFINKLSKGANCSIETVIKIADAFGVTTDEVLGRGSAKVISPVEELLLKTTAGNDDIARAALRSAQGEKLIKEMTREKGRAA